MASWSRSSRSSEDINRGKKLIEATEKGREDEIRILLQSGVSVNADEFNKSLFYASQNYMTPLQVAAAHGFDLCVELLLENGAELNARDRFDVTAVHMAAEKGHYQCLKLLLDAGADCNIATKYSKIGCYTATPHPGGTTPLHLAAANNHVKCVTELIQNGADYNAVDEQGRTSLYVAAEQGLEECVLVHLRNAIGRDILSLPVKKSGETPLHCCVKLGMKECVVELLDHGSDVNHRNHAGYSPLHCSTFHVCGKEWQSLEIMKELVLKGYNTDINLPDQNGMTPLHFVSFSDSARMERRPEAAAFLISYGADVDIMNKRGNNLIQAELKNGSDRTILRAIVKCLPHVPSLASLNVAPPTPLRSNGASHEAQAGENGVNGGSGDGFHQGNTTPAGRGWAKYQWYKQLASCPRSLQHCCRYAVRQALGYRRLRHIKDLPIPTSLKEYVLLEYDEFK